MGALALLTLGCASHSGKPTPPNATPTAIPAPLVAALLDGRVSSPGRAPELLVGAVPQGFPAAFVPGPPARIVGSMNNRDEMMVVFEDSTRRLAAVLEDAFVRAGYAKPAPTPRAGFSGGYDGYGFCGDSGVVSVESLGGAQRHMARVTYRRGPYRAMCFARSEAEQVRLTLPALTPPAGARVTRSGGGGGSDGVNSNAEFSEMSLTPVAVVAHYAAQLTAAGWVGAAPAISDQVVAQYFEAKDSSGATWSGTLMAVRHGTAISLSINMRPRPRR